ncbi:hypothetical protein OAP63_08625 [Vibrio sp.]|uniref:Lipocalin-like domain-containing protein n=1 Tax=Vibrio viridaestus TaxID=2487322 RepID=A0A3N9TEB9_9VIBR|nr:hypothetical protein [Vibrio viridaestus]MDC0610786.1 hypothetical protein [Vibrio sp.]RQW62571.1 hypothetical protein EES38_12655 [Vibrio viridaestus]
MRSLFSPLALSLVSTVFVAPVMAKVDTNLLAGKWQCNSNFVDLYETNIKSVHELSKNGRLNSSGDVILAMPQSTISVGYHLEAKGVWSVKEDQLTVRGEVTSVKNTMHPEWDKMLGLKQLLPETLKGTATITHLDASSMTLDDTRTGREYVCHRMS